MQCPADYLVQRLSGIARNIGPRLCTILDMNFGESTFHALE